MKIRSCFVSNSSTSSFIAIGQLFDKETIRSLDWTKIDLSKYVDKWTTLEEIQSDPFEYMQNEIHHMGCTSEYLVGFLDTFSSDGDGSRAMSFERLEQYKAKAIETLKLLGLPTDIAIYFGTYYS